MSTDSRLSHQVSLGEYIACASMAIGVDPVTLAHSGQLGLAESALRSAWPEFGGRDLRPDPWAKAAAVCCRLIRNHPLQDGNKRAAWAAMRWHVTANGGTWTEGIPSPEDARDLMEAVASRSLSEEGLGLYLRNRLSWA